MFNRLSCSIVLLGCLLLGAPAFAASAGFSFDDRAGEYLDVLLDGKIVARYMDAHDVSTKERRMETYKPYLHVFDAEGKEPITKGPGGEYTHHRGIFIGWRMITFDGKKYDRWHMIGLTDKKDPEKSTKPGDIVHEKFLEQKADADSATFTSLTHWDSDPGAPPLLVEERTFTFHRAPAPARLTIDFTSKLTAANGDVMLDGDPEHAGIHYRPSDEVDREKTLYVIPAENPHPHKDVDYPWVGETYTLKNGKTYSVVEMIHPSDPKEEHWSAYRNYGRFGAFFKQEVKSGQSLELKYRFLIADGEMPPIEQIEKSYDEFAGTSNPTPKVTVMPAEKSAPAKPKTPKTPKA